MEKNTIKKFTNKTNMKGALHKTESGWQVWYSAKDERYHGSIIRILPLHPDDTIGIGQEEKEVEFEIVANEGEPLGRGEQPYKQYAKLVDKATRPVTEDDAWPDYPTRADQLREQGWLEIDKAFSKYWTEYTDGDFSHFTAVEKAQRKIGWLKENYNPPTKKQD